MLTKLTDIGHAICLWLGIAGGLIASFLGGFDMLLKTLIILMIIDYITGVINAIVQKKLSSEIGAKGIFKKVMILLFVGVGAALDSGLGLKIIRNTLATFYILNEAISVIENGTSLGIPFPKQITNILAQLKDKTDNGDKGV